MGSFRIQSNSFQDGKSKMRLYVIAVMNLAIASTLLTGNVFAQSSEDDLVRAGCPQLIKKSARVGYGPKYVAYYVGGGASSFHGEPRYCEEGTFGVDYKPIGPGFRDGVTLGWWHGRRWQGGTGQYEPNNPVRAFPNLWRR